MLKKAGFCVKNIVISFLEVIALKYTTELCKIVCRKQLTDTMFDFTVEAPKIAEGASCGQFANIVADSKTLRRPISICEKDAEKGTLRFVFDVRGEGTKIISQKKEGEEFDIFGPLGNGFKPLEGAKKVIVVGGGIGVPPLLETAKAYGGAQVIALLGFRDAEHVILEEDFKKYADTYIATDDGSYGHGGFVTELLREQLEKGDVDIIHACGPIPMLKLIAESAAQFNVPCQVSLEERMGCGIGACLVCACKIKVAQGDGWTYKHVCKDGPVFNSKEVDWNV